jgi:hypothetical protein
MAHVAPDGATNGTSVARVAIMRKQETDMADTCRDAGVPLTDEQWDALPPAARRRLLEHPRATNLDRKKLAELARWMLATFPPGWRLAP